MTFLLFWGAIALGRIPRFGFFAPIAGALAPGVAAVIVTGIGEGKDGVRALVRRLALWRVPPIWYVIALGLPLAGWLVSAAVAAVFGAFSTANLRAVMPVLVTSWIMFLFAAVEELGWRGFALPRLLERHRALAASVILGTLHAIWHWPAVVPSSAWNDVPRLAPGLLRGTTLIVAEAVLITWIFLHTRGSLLPVTVYHGMTNVALVLYQGIEGMPWLRALISVLMATGVVLATGPTLVRRRVVVGSTLGGTMRTPAIILGAILLSACGNPSASGPDPIEEPADFPGAMVGGTCTGSIAQYCAHSAGRCAGYDEAVARLTPLCAQTSWVVQRHECVGVYRSISWRDSLLGGGEEYFSHDGRLVAAFRITDYFPYCDGRSGSQVFGDVPVCPTARITTSLCAR